MSDKVLRYLSGKKGLAAPKAVAPAAAAPAGASAISSAPKAFALPSTTTFVSGLFYLSTFLFVLFLVLVLIHFTVYPIFGALTTKATTAQPDSQSGWMKTPPLKDEPAELTPPLSQDYTLSLEVNVKNDFSVTKAPHIILYNSSVKQASTIVSSATEIDLPRLFSNSNLLVYLDSGKNDMKIAFLRTDGKSELISVISNIPLGRTFRLTIVFVLTSPSYAEVYINGKLNTTHVFKGTPRSLGDTYYFYPPPSTLGSSIKVGTLYYWPRALSAIELQGLLPMSSQSFFV